MNECSLIRATLSLAVHYCYAKVPYVRLMRPPARRARLGTQCSQLHRGREGTKSSAEVSGMTAAAQHSSHMVNRIQSCCCHRRSNAELDHGMQSRPLTGKGHICKVMS
jgi:hypothetical protein